MQPLNRGLIPRVSSATSSLRQQLDIPQSTADDFNIAHGLLNNPRTLHRQYSFNSAHRIDVDGSSVLEDGSEVHASLTEARPRRALLSSNTWTTSSGEILSDQDEVDDRSAFVHEYNRLAKKHGVRILVPEDFDNFNEESLIATGKPPSWFTRKILRRTSSSQSHKQKPDRQLKHRRSVSDLSLRLRTKRDKLKDKDLQDLVRLCGASLLYLPPEYAAGSLAVPTCLRATAQYLVQHAPSTRGVFRISGSYNTVAALYNHYCDLNKDGDVVSGTVRCPTIPEHIKCDVHDVASAFKKFISGLPGGILGSLPIFDSFISIQSQLHGDPELTRTKQTKVRARLIALAIATLRSQYRRELICTVFGLLCMIGRIAETAKREDDRGRPLPTSDLMGYGPLSIIFGPLLVGELLENYSMRLANPHGGLILLPLSPQKSRKEKSSDKSIKTKQTTEGKVPFENFVDKIKVANGITEMLITHWRDVVRHMKNLKSLKPLTGYKNLGAGVLRQPFLRPSASDTFAIRKPPNWDDMRPVIRRGERSLSPTPTRRTNEPNAAKSSDNILIQNSDNLEVRKQRSRPRPRHVPSQRLSGVRSYNVLSPTAEEQPQFKDLDTKASKILSKQVTVTPPKTLEKQDFLSSTTQQRMHLPRQGGSHYTQGGRGKLHKGRPSPKGFTVNLGTPRKEPMASPAPKHEAVAIPTPNKLLKSHQSCGILHKRSSKDVWGQKAASFIAPETSQPRQQQLVSRIFFPRIQNTKDNEAIKVSFKVPQGIVSENVRRIAASEPGQPSRCFPPSGRMSKSASVDSNSKCCRKQDNESVRSRDPLAQVSHEEDVASLTALAVALNEVPLEIEIKTDAPSGFQTSTSNVYQQRQCNQRTGEKETDAKLNTSMSKHSPNDLSAFGSKGSRYVKNYESNISPNNAFVRCETIHNDRPKTVVIPSNATPNRKVFDRSGTQCHDSPAGSVRAIAARFNNVETGSGSMPSAANSPSKAGIDQFSSRADMPKKEGIVSHYTINPPSPARSKSDKSPRINIQATACDASQTRHTNSSPVHFLAPTHVTKKIFNDSTPFRSIKNPSELMSASTTKISKVSPTQQQSFPAQQIPSSMDGAGSRDSITEYFCHSSAVPLDKDNETTVSNIRCPLSVVDGNSPDFLALIEQKQPNSPLEASHFHSTTPRFISPVVSGEFIVTKNYLPTKEATSVSKNSRYCSNSILHSQIRSFQMRVAEQSEEIRRLKQQLAVRPNAEISSMSDQLRDAEVRVQVWKSRSEVAEKQLEMLIKIPSRNNSDHRARYPVALGSSELGTECIVEDSDERIGKAFCGLDGAVSDQAWISEETTETVIRDIQDPACIENHKRAHISMLTQIM